MDFDTESEVFTISDVRSSAIPSPTFRAEEEEEEKESAKIQELPAVVEQQPMSISSEVSEG